MFKRLPSVLGWTIIGVCYLAFGWIDVPAAQHLAEPSAAYPPPELRPDQQMRVLEHRARFDMILYAGSFGQSEFGLSKARSAGISLRSSGGK